MHAGSSWKPTTQERLVASAGTAMVMGLMGYMLVVGLSAQVQKRVEESLLLLNLRSPPRPPPLHPQARIEPHKAKAAGRASPKNLRQKATDVVAPPPMRLPPPPPIVSAPVPSVAAAAASGASDRRGPGQGAGGEGYGPGSGGYGEGEGDGGEPPRQVAGKLRFKDLPPELYQLIEPGTERRVGVEYHVTAQGYVDNCRSTRSSGIRALDRLTCRFIEERFRFRPSRDEQGRPVGSFVEEDHTWIVPLPPDRP